jgi:predicted lipid-binding transport protein (Tim44 family)
MMKKWLVWVSLAFMVLGTQEALAKRIGGGFSVGRSSGNVTQRYNAPAKPAPTQNATNAAKPATPAAAAAPTRSRWGGMLGGLAAGLGLAWLASSLGLGAEFGNVLLILLAVMVGVYLIRRLSGGVARRPAYAGAGAGMPAAQAPYSSSNVGNDAAARPWEQNHSAFDATPASPSQGGSMIGSALGQQSSAPLASGLSGSQSWGVPEGFDSEGFLRACKNNFVQLQSAWDAADTAKLRTMMTDEMLQEIEKQLAERETHTNGQPNVTEVVSLDAQLLGIEELSNEYMASVEFSGMIKEQPQHHAAPFREVWNIVKSKQSGGWLVAGVQALG